MTGRHDATNGGPFGLTVTPVGTDDRIAVAGGKPAFRNWSTDTADAIAYLPHSCDEWIIGEGGTEHVIARLKQMRDEIDAAIAYLTAHPGQE